MAYDNPEAFGKLGLKTDRDGREIGRYDHEVETLAEASGNETDLLPTYQRLLGVLSTHGAEVARMRVIHGYDDEARTVLAEHVFFFPWQNHQGTILTGILEDNKKYTTADGTLVRYDRKDSMQGMGNTGEVMIQYDGLAEPPELRVLDMQGGDQQGKMRSGLSDELRADLKAAAA